MTFLNFPPFELKNGIHFFLLATSQHIDVEDLNNFSFCFPSSTSIRFCGGLNVNFVIKDSLSKCKNKYETKYCLLPFYKDSLPITWLEKWELGLELDNKHNIAPAIYVMQNQEFSFIEPIDQFVTSYTKNNMTLINPLDSLQLFFGTPDSNKSLQIQNSYTLFRDDPCFNDTALKDVYDEILNCEIIIGDEILKKGNILVCLKLEGESFGRILSFSIEGSFSVLRKLFIHIGKLNARVKFQESLGPISSTSGNIEYTMKENMVYWPIFLSFFIGDDRLNRVPQNFLGVNCAPFDIDLSKLIVIKDSLFVLYSATSNLSIFKNSPPFHELNKVIFPFYMKDLVAQSIGSTQSTNFFVTIIIDGCSTILPVDFIKGISIPIIPFKVLLNILRQYVIESMNNQLKSEVNKGKFQSINQARRETFRSAFIEIEYLDKNFGTSEVITYKWPIRTFQSVDEEYLALGKFHERLIHYNLKEIGLDMDIQVITVKLEEKEMRFSRNLVKFIDDDNKHCGIIEIYMN